MKKILIAHFDQYTRRLLEATAQAIGYTVETVQDGLDVVDRTLDEHPDAVLLGTSLPGLSGLDVARALRSLQPVAQIPIVFFTDNDRETTRVLQIALPNVDCVQGPLDAMRLREQLERLVSAAPADDRTRRMDMMQEALTITDPPTGLYARSYILHRLAYEGARATRYHHDIAVVLLGIRNAEPLAKRYGQMGMNQLCMDAANLLRRSIRMVDLIGRTGGDEFLVIAPHTNLEGARTVATRLCNMLDAAVYQVNGTRTRLVMCAGIAATSESSLADNLALYANALDALKVARLETNERIVNA